MSRNGVARPILMGIGSCAALTLLAIAFADRPLATLSHRLIQHKQIFIWLTWIADVPLPASAIILALAGLGLLLGWRPGPMAKVLIAASVATLVAESIKDELKLAFGRTWPETWTNGNPSWIGDHVFGFFPFHGGAGWASFPSGHTTVIAAPMAVFWRAMPRWRILWGALVVLVAIGLLGADYHFLGDIIAGLYLGVAVGAGMSVLIR